MSKAKMKDEDKQQNLIALLQQRYVLVEKFIKIKETADLTDLIAASQLLLEEPDVETGVRIGDIYALIVEFGCCFAGPPLTPRRRLAAREQWKQAYVFIDQLRERVPNVNISFYINIKACLAHACCRPSPPAGGRGDPPRARHPAGLGTRGGAQRRRYRGRDQLRRPISDFLALLMSIFTLV